MKDNTQPLLFGGKATDPADEIRVRELCEERRQVHLELDRLNRRLMGIGVEIGEITRKDYALWLRAFNGFKEE